MTRGVPTLAELGTTPGETADALATALASLVCRALKHRTHPGPSCAACLPVGRALAPVIGKVLFACRTGERGAGGRSAGDYAALGRALELLETLAGTRAATGAPR